MAASVCNWFIVVFVLLYIAALFLLLIGTFGWFGQERDPLSGVFLLPLGLPWNQLLGFLSESARPWAAAFAPIVNIAILKFLCGRLSA